MASDGRLVALDDDGEHLSASCVYVWNNPVRADLCVEAHEWLWSGRF